MKIKIYTDGACSGNPGIGGWAVLFLTNKKSIPLSGGEKDTTNNRMELYAVIKALKTIINSKKSNIPVFELYSDSAYVVDAINKNWIYNWKMNGWKTKTGDEVKNKDLWLKLLDCLNKIKTNNIALEIIKVKGHSGNSFNDRVDALAKLEILKIKGEM